jgi:hypothetical protein
VTGHLDVVSFTRSGVHRERHVARIGKESNDVRAEDVIQLEPGGSKPLSVRTEDASVGGDEAAAGALILEEKIY